MQERWARLVLQLTLCVAALRPCVDIAAFAQDGENRAAQGSSNLASLQNIRITPYYHSSVERLSEGQQILLKDVLINATLSWFGRVLKVRPEHSALTFERSCSVTHRMVRYKRYCVGTCSETTQCGPVTIPEHHLQPCRSCAHNNCTVSSGSPAGVADSDLVVYVSAIADRAKCRSQFVYGGHCQQESQLDRPIAAYLNLCPAFLLTSSEFYHLQIATVVHKMVRILAFSESLFPFFRDKRGNPLNERGRDGLPLHTPLGDYVSDGTVRYFRHAPWLVADYVKSVVDGMEGPPVHLVRMIITPNVVREVQEHFNCNDMIGGELESQKHLGAADSYWEKRVFGEEIMTASASYHPVLSRLTLALLHDSGWYLPDYSYGEQLHWGRGRGCGFIKGSCYKWVGPTMLNTPDGGGGSEENDTNIVPFCRRGQVGSESCVDQRRAVGVCIIKNYPAKLPEQFRYFSTDRRGGAFPLVDYCPLFQYDFYSRVQVGRNCMTAPDTPSTFVPEMYGPDSRCFEHDWMEPGDNVTGAGEGGGEGVGGGAGCYTYECRRRRVLVNVAGRVVVCRHAGQRETVQYSHNTTTYTGHIVCPAYNEVCASYDCPGMCSGRGNCDRGHCRCQPGYYDEDCSRSYLDRLLSCDDVNCYNGGSCVSNGNLYGFTCTCPAGFTGMLCETELVPDPCHNITCSGNRFCIRTRMGTVGLCDCLPGYGGDDCDRYLLCEERGKPCYHGHCERNSGEPVCVCDEGYRGPLCGQVDLTLDPCLSSPCRNGGKCTAIMDENSGKFRYQCSCTPGFKGRRCGNKKHPCLHPNPCLNGGRCERIKDVDEWGLFYCVCPAEFTGQLCDIPLI